MQKYAICLGYLPILNYSGFSDQLHDPQNIFTLVISALKNARLIDPTLTSKIRFASRTDRGVGALSQIISLNSKQVPILTEINSYLPESIRALGIASVSSDFQPRRDAILRTYSYFLTTSKDFDYPLARKTLAMLMGKHDFRNFAKQDNKKEKGTFKTIEVAEILPLGNCTYQIRISSKSFLWQMVRRIIGHLIELNNGRCDSEYTNHLLASKIVKFKPNAAPSENLVLESVHYKDVQFQYDQKSLLTFQNTLTEQLMTFKAKTALFNFITTHVQEKMS